MSNISWATLGNKLLNLGVLIVFCSYFTNKYLISYIKKILKERAMRLIDLKKEKIDLQEKIAEIIQGTQAKQVYATQLLGKIQMWKTVMEERERARDAEQKMLEQKSLEYLQRRADGLCQEYLKREVMPQIFSETKSQLFDFFTHKNAQKQYLDKCLKGLVRENGRG